MLLSDFLTNGIGLTNIPIGGFATVFEGGATFKATKTPVARAIYSILSGLYPTNATTYEAIYNTAPFAGVYASSIAFGNGIFVAVGANGSAQANCQVSSDGYTWNQYAMPSSQQWTNVVFGNGYFVAFCATSAVCAYSPDGVNWTSLATPAVLSSVVYGNGMVIGTIATASSTAYYLPIGPGASFTWATATLPNSAIWTGCAYGNGVFTMIGKGSSSGMYAAYSATGTAWSAGNIPTTYLTFAAVTYGNGIFVAVSTSGAVLRSPDGVSWTAYTAISSPGGTPSSLAYANGLFALVQNGTANAVMFTSPDGITWTSRALAASGLWTSIAFGLGLFILTQWNSSTPAATIAAVWAEYTSTVTQVVPFTSVTAASMATSATWQSVAYGNSVWCAVAGGSVASTVSNYSANGTSWTASTLPSSQKWQSIAFGAGIFVAHAVGSATYATCTDGKTWTSRTLPVANASGYVSYDPVSAAFYYTTAYASGTGNVIYTSANGTTWSIYAYTNAGLPQDSSNVPYYTAPGGLWACSNGSKFIYDSLHGNLWGIGLSYLINAYPNTWQAQTNNLYDSNGNYANASSAIPLISGITGVAYGNGVTVAIANSITTNNTWSSAAHPACATPIVNSYGNVTGYQTSGNFMYRLDPTTPAGWTGTVGSLNASNDAQVGGWQIGTLPGNAAWSEIIFTNGQFIAIGASLAGSGNTVVAISTNGINWSVVAVASNAWTGIASNGTIAVLVSGLTVASAAAAVITGAVWTGAAPTSQYVYLTGNAGQFVRVQ
ncbi:hypothetical protein [Paraburkholderia unamae]|uniref:Uncharacterized protein n=1 Tax=Paraburkholderia unamae TaxID=219649 RepID=A0ABX5KM14_9BURK|nr:hypothetical protein [Paraburkholderia unamae]PVX80065.1 hypothetical protein C7402_112252 [Paraburkholderia unamae]